MDNWTCFVIGYVYVALCTFLALNGLSPKKAFIPIWICTAVFWPIRLGTKLVRKFERWSDK